jgi:hypothetical protein
MTGTLTDDDTMIRILSFIIIFILLFTLPGSVSGKNVNPSRMEPLYIYLSSYEATQGHTVLLNIECADPRDILRTLDITFGKKNIVSSLLEVEGKENIICLVPVPLETRPGPSHITLSWVKNENEYCAAIPLTIVPGVYTSTRISVNAAYVKLRKEDKQRAAQEFKEVSGIVSSGISSRIWQNPWRLPVVGPAISEFGMRRIFNSEITSIHKGVDLKAKTGTTVYAANDGIVKLAKGLFYAGNCVIVDHGMSIFTTYAHLSSIHVKPGQEVSKGQVIGKSGSTGRVSGPHLHWGVLLGGVRVSPFQFLDVLNTLPGMK